jgi:TonB family protein
VPERFRAAMVLTLLLVWSASARAQEARAKVPQVTPPVVENSTEVPYPKDGHGNATVLLDLDIDRDGRVLRAVVTRGAPPFSEAARRAALGWRFTPARRGGVSVAALIRARIVFRQPPSASGREAGPSAPVEAQPNAVPQAPIEINVHGKRAKRREIGETTLSSADVRDMPGAFGDPFRAIEALPGVIPVASGLPYFYIRGAPPNDDAYYVDGIRVPLLFHVGIGEGVIHPALVDHVDFYPGAAPAAYGRAAGAIINAETREPARTAHGDVNLRLVDAGALLESPLDGGRGSALVAGRYGYPGPILSAITSNVRLGYWDYQARATWRVADRDTLGVFAFGSHDYVGTADTINGRTGPIIERLGSDFHRVDLRFDRELPGGHLRAATTFGYDWQGGVGAGDQDGVITSIDNLSVAMRVEVDQKVSHAVGLRGGADVELDHYGFSAGQAPDVGNGLPAAQVPSSADPPPTNLTWGAHADVVWHAAPGVEVVPGARVDLFESKRSSAPLGAQAITTVPAFDPRLAVRVKLAPAVTYLAALGLAHQYPALRVGAIPALLLAVPGFPLGDAELQTAAHASQGIELALPLDFTLTTTGFLSDWSGLTDLAATCTQITPPVTPPDWVQVAAPYACPSDQPVHGFAYGVELLLRRPLSKRLTGWLSYTLSRSTRAEHFVTLSGGDRVATVASDYDRTHVINAIFSYDLGRRWRAGVRFVFLSGTPYSNLAGSVPVPPYNAYRDPPFFRLDVRLEKSWPLGKTGTIAFIAEGQNVTLSKEVTPFGASCTTTSTGGPPGGGTTYCHHPDIGPITIPSIGVEATF